MKTSEQNSKSSYFRNNGLKNIFKGILAILLFITVQCSFAQVGIGNTDPQASLDITASSTTSPANIDGILIPRVANLTSTGSMTADQDGMLVFYTGTANSGKGFYYWNQATTTWVFLNTGNKNTLDQAYNEGGNGAGKNITADNGAVRINGTDGFLVTGTQGSGNSIDSEITGAGTRMVFNPNKASFRAGYVLGNQWDNGNTGPYSTAFGYSTIASGDTATAFGSDTTASGNASTTFGYNTTASGTAAVAFGTSTASGEFSTAFGANTTSSGNSSSSFGGGTTALSFGETTVGLYNTTYSPASTIASNNGDRIFVVGNGTHNANRSNALTIYKSGLMNINDEYNMPLTDGTAGQIMSTDGAGNVSWVASSSLTGISTFKYPDGFSNITPIMLSNLGLTTTYTVPAGKNLYITNITSLSSSNVLSINGTSVFQGTENRSNNQSVTNPIIVGSGETISASASAPFIVSGFLIDVIITPVTINSSSYTVPANKILVILNYSRFTTSAGNLALDGVVIYRGTGSLQTTAGLTSFFNPFFASSGQIIHTNGGTINGYLMN